VQAEVLGAGVLNADLFAEIGIAAARMHNLSRSYQAEHPSAGILQWNQTGNVFNPGPSLGAAGKTIAGKYSLAARSIMSLPKNPDDFGIVHLDTHPANIIVGADRKVGLIDFDDICLGWNAMDIHDALAEIPPA
jgi:Ser/Thr protein kinase RdoA (MazF antagonist)